MKIVLDTNCLGHSDVKTTQIYAQIVDEKKQAAANAINITSPFASHFYIPSASSPHVS